MADWRISGDPRSIGCSGSVAGDHVEDISTGTIYVKTGGGTLDFTPATSAYNAGGVGVLTVEEVDGSPSYGTVGTLRFDQADGFVLTQPSANIAKVNITGIPQANVSGLTAALATYQLLSGKDAPSGYAGLSAGSKISGAEQTYGAISSTACEGNDTRLSDARTPTAHATTHKNGGGDEVATATAGANAIPKAGVGGKLANTWIPDFVASGASHASGGVPDPGAGSGTAKFLREDASWATPAGTGAPLGSSYVVIANDATLTTERALAAESTVLSLTDAGANSTVTVGVAANGITDAKLRQGGALTVVGRSANSTGNVADIASGGDARFLSQHSSALAFSALVSGDLPSTGDINARLAVSKAGSAVGTRRGLNLIEGSNVTLTVADNAGSERVDVTVTASISGGAAPDISALSAGTSVDPLADYADFYDASAAATRKLFVRDWWSSAAPLIDYRPLSATALTGWTFNGTPALLTGDTTHFGGLSILSTPQNIQLANKTLICFGGAKLHLRIVFATQSDIGTSGSDDFVLYAGFHDATTAVDPVDGAYVRFAKSTNTGKFQYKTSSASSRTTDDTGITVLASTKYVIDIELNAAATSSTCTINGSLTNTETLTLPSGAGKETGVFVGCAKVSGATSQGINFYRLTLWADDALVY